MLLSIGKSSLARAAAATARPTVETASKQDTLTACAVAVSTIRLPKGQKLPAAADALVASIAKNGVLEPLTLAQTGEEKLTLISGASRLAAAKEAGLDTVPAVILSMTATEASAARREIARFAAATLMPVSAQADKPTAVGQAMPAWLL
jgi:hypothetical protein